MLPYHKLGVIKYEPIGKTYLLKDVDPPRSNDLIKFKNIIEVNNIRCEIL